MIYVMSTEEQRSDDDIDDDESDIEDSSDEDGSDDGEYTDMAGLLTDLLSTDDDNVCTAMLKISSQLETTNRLLLKLVSSQIKK
jgi:hypothetical protein